MSEATDTTRRSTYRASRLRVSDIPGTAEIRPGHGDDLTVTLTGPTDLVDKVRCGTSGDTLTVAGPHSGTGGVTMISSGGRQSNVFISGRGGGMVVGTGSMVIVNGRIISGGQDVTVVENRTMEAVIEVPAGTPVAIEDGSAGVYSVGDIGATLDVRMNGGGEIHAGRMLATRVQIHGSADFSAQSVTQALTVSIHGSGDVRVRDGNVDDLTIDVHGSGDARYGGTARRANLTVMGSGDIAVNVVTEHLAKRCMGSGDIEVYDAPRRDPSRFWE